MTDLLKSGSDWLATVQRTSVSQSVTYSRGPDSVSVLATIGTIRQEIVDEHGRIFEVDGRDFLIDKTDLVLNAVEITPERGDTITQGTYTYEVTSLGGEPPWRWFGRYHTRRRIHTKLKDQG